MLKTVLLQKIKPYRRVNKKGFTLMEMLIVVAIIAILIAVAIPVFSAQFHAADEAYAVQNADKELKAAATAVIGGNNEDGVAKWLLEHANF